FIPEFFPKADAQLNIYDFVYPHHPKKISQNNLNPQTLLEKGKVLYDKRNFTEAIFVLEQAVQIFQSQNNLIQQSIALSNISNAYQQIGEYQQALSYITKSRKLLDNQSNIPLFAQVLDIQANLQLILGQPLLALENWKQATAIYKRENFNNAKIRSLINQNLALQSLGRYRQAITILSEVLVELNQQPASVLKITALRSFGDVQLYIGEIDASLRTLQQSYKLAQEINSNPQIAQTLLSLGNAQRTKGNKQHNTEGIELSSSSLQSTAIFAKDAPLVYISSPISSEIKKLYQQAIQTYEQTVAITNSPAIKIKAQLNKLGLLIKLQEFSKAGKLSSELESAINKLAISETSIRARINLAQNLLFLKQVSPENASKWEDIAKILALSIKQGSILSDKRLQAYGMGTLGSVYLQTENLADARKLTKKAIDLAVAIGAKDIAYLWQWQLGYIFKTEDNISQAIDYYSQAVNNLNDLRGDLLA
ncbi:MAG: tetratricopeptide repeat protein, partial [Cyanobacteria bacterium J06649_11]